jgi:hypothetical protein
MTEKSGTKAWKMIMIITTLQLCWTQQIAIYIYYKSHTTEPIISIIPTGGVLLKNLILSQIAKIFYNLQDPMFIITFTRASHWPLY